MALVEGSTEKYDVLEIIGRGAFGIIRKVRRKSDGHILCRKEINYLKMSPKERDQLHAEFSILSTLDHVNIVGYYHREHLKQTQELYLYMEYCGGGDLGMVIKNLKRTGEFAKEEFVWRMFSQLITALYRCHYGIEPPEPGSDVSRQKDPRELLKDNQAAMILHRDLKPENIFLGADQSVKLGDFGLSKLMQSNDFASTYVGTPFYMSPEICNAEKYTLHSDIWSVGCIMYELCMKEPPFDAHSHIQLIQKIRKGNFKPLPNHYSQDLKNVIASCLRTNPNLRPDTASLLTIPYVWIARKTQEIVQTGLKLKIREDLVERKMKQAEERLSAMEADKETMKVEIDATLRREWEVKAHLEIERQSQINLDRLQKRFDKEVEERVALELEKRDRTTASRPSSRALREIRNSSSISRIRSKENMNPHSSTTTASGEEDFPSTTDLTDLSDLSLSSPMISIESVKPVPALRKTKTPFTRSKTTFDSPVDIQMGEPSPMSISSLALSPRRNAAAQAVADKAAMTGKNIFAEAARTKRSWEPTLAYTSDDEDDMDGSDDEFILSPTRPKGIPGSANAVATSDPFKMPFKPRPGLLRQNTTATMQKLTSQPSLFPTTGMGAQIRAGIAAANGNVSGIPRCATENDLRGRPMSPNRRLSKIPSRQDLAGDALACLSRSPSRKGTALVSKLARGGPAILADDSSVARPLNSKLAAGAAAASGGIIGGRTLVELAQARAGGRPVQAKVVVGVERELSPVPVWDADVMGDDMPSPFLKRDMRVVKGLMR